MQTSYSCDNWMICDVIGENCEKYDLINCYLYYCNTDQQIRLFILKMTSLWVKPVFYPCSLSLLSEIFSSVLPVCIKLDPPLQSAELL